MRGSLHGEQALKIRSLRNVIPCALITGLYFDKDEVRTDRTATELMKLTSAQYTVMNYITTMSTS